MERDVGDSATPTQSALARRPLGLRRGARGAAPTRAGAWAEGRKWVKRNKPLASALAAAVLAVIGGGIGLCAQGGLSATKAESELAKGEAARADLKTRGGRRANLDACAG